MSKYKNISLMLIIGYLTIVVLWLISVFSPSMDAIIDLSCGYYFCPIQNSTGMPIIDQISEGMK